MSLTRRQVLAGAAASLGVAAATQLRWTQAAAADPSGIPAIMGRSRAVSGVAVVEQTEFPLTHLGVAWPATQNGTPKVRLRTAAGWQPWQAITGCVGGRDGAFGLDHGGLMRAAEATGYEIAGAAGAVVLGEINVLAGPLLRAAGAPEIGSIGGLPLPTPYRSRAGWGADEKLRFAADGSDRYPAEYYPVQTLTVHHTVTPLDDPDPASTVRAIYYDHTITRDFGDIGYHLLIDGHGTVYEGRWSGDDGLPVFGGAPGPDGRPQMNNAGHVLGYNAGNVGIALLGDFTTAPPTAAAVDSLVRVLFLLSKVCRLDPVGRTTYANPITGKSITVDTISGHRDYLATECPGDKLYPMLPAIRKRAATLVVPGLA